MTETVVPARKGPHSVTHAFPNTCVDERGPVALHGIVCRVIRKKLYRKHVLFSVVIEFLVYTEWVYRTFTSKLSITEQQNLAELILCLDILSRIIES